MSSWTPIDSTITAPHLALLLVYIPDGTYFMCIGMQLPDVVKKIADEGGSMPTFWQVLTEAPPGAMLCGEANPSLSPA